MEELNRIWEDQADFNRNFFSPPTDFKERSERTKELLLHLISECDELLRCGVWKPHRREAKQENEAQVANELTDILKYWISLCQVWGRSPEDVVRDYWRKSAVCRQRYSEEFINNLEGDFAVVDIDGVLADYAEGLLRWVRTNYPSLQKNCDNLPKGTWIDASTMGVSSEEWQEVKHQFRISGGKLYLPLYPGAQELLDFLSMTGLKVALLTSRPIDLYPNIYTDTLEWLQNHNLKFDYVWWHRDKGESLVLKGVRSRVRVAIDDDRRYIDQFAEMGIPSIWVNQRHSRSLSTRIISGQNREIHQVGSTWNAFYVCRELFKMEEMKCQK